MQITFLNSKTWQINNSSSRVDALSNTIKALKQLNKSTEDNKTI